MLELTSGRPAAPVALRRSPTPSTPLPGLRAEWRRLARRLADPDVELESDTVSVLVLTYDRLRAAGGTVDAMAAALVTQLRLQLADAEATVDG